MQLNINIGRVTEFNLKAETLESVTIDGRTFECFRDYYDTPRWRAQNGGRSIMVREPGKRCGWMGCTFYVPSARYRAGVQAFRSGSKGERALSAWMAAMVSKYR
jgi:hypothetical protein